MLSKKLGLFGYGRLGQYLARQLAPDFSLVVHDPGYTGRTSLGQPFVSAQVAASQGVVLLSVPISAMQEVCEQIAGYLQPGLLLLDTCSVKMIPLEIMGRTLPDHVDVIGTHPLFGPDSAAAGLQGHKIVLCPLSEKRVDAVQNYLENKGLKVLIGSPELHDKAMASTQCLFHMMARAIQEMGVEVGEIATPGPERLYRDFALLQKDTSQLFSDMQNMNPFAADFRREFISILRRIDSQLSDPQSQGQRAQPPEIKG